MTSSKMSSAPLTSQIARSEARKPGSGGTHPMFPAYGSTMIAASGISLATRAAAVASLYATVNVSRAVPSVTPAESGRPSVATPDPAFTSNASAWPW